MVGRVCRGVGVGGTVDVCLRVVWCVYYECAMCLRVVGEEKDTEHTNQSE